MARELRFSTESVAGRRKGNQDAVLAERFPGDGLLLAVADGMGGHAAGEVASALALETLLKAIRAGESLEDGVRLANWQVHKKAQAPGRQGMGTTLTAVLLRDDRFFLANVGDSRAYRISRTGIRQLTEDHSFVAEAMKRGQPEDVAKTSPWKDALTRSVGTDEAVEVDVFGPFPVEDDTALLLCSDGLHKTLDRTEIWTIFLESEDLHEAARTLVTKALEGGSDDNITVAIAEFGAFPRRRAGEDAHGEGWEGDQDRRGRRNLGKQPEGDAEDEWESPPRPVGGGGSRKILGAEPPMTLPDMILTARSQARGPWEMKAAGRPRVVGGAKPRRSPWRRALYAFTFLAIVAAAAFLYLR